MVDLLYLIHRLNENSHPNVIWFIIEQLERKSQLFGCLQCLGFLKMYFLKNIVDMVSNKVFCDQVKLKFPD